MKKRFFSILLALCMVLCFVPTAAQAGEGDQHIIEVNLLGLSGELWSYQDVTFATIDDGASYTIKEQVWNATDGTSIKPDSENRKPKARMDYTFIITLEAKDGYAFPIKSESAVFYDGTIRLDGTEYDGGAVTVSSDGKTLKVVLFLLTTAKGVTLHDETVRSESELASALADPAVTLITLAGDIDLVSTQSVSRTVTLDLNGYVLSNNGSRILEIKDGGHLTVMDSRPTAAHTFRIESDRIWKLDESSGTETVSGGVITGGNAENGGGIYVESGGRFTMNGGNIVGCRAASNGSGIYAESYGGGVYVDGGAFTMNGGSVTGCVAMHSGGVYVKSGTFTLDSGTIQNCTANGRGGVAFGSGGGVYMEGDSQFTMTGGSITGCAAADGGGVVMENGTFTMTGGVIQNCTAKYHGGALYLRSTMNAGGGTVDGTVAVSMAYDPSTKGHDIPGVIQGAAGSTGATAFKQEVLNFGEIKYGIFSGKVTVGYSVLSGTISGGTFNGPVNIVDTNDDEIKGGIFNDTVTIDRGRITGGTFNGLIKNNSTDPRFVGTYSPLGIVGEEPTAEGDSVYDKVTFDPAGGTMDYPERYFLNKTHISDQIKPNDRAGYFFAGWYNGTKLWDPARDEVTGDLTLTAHWTACDHSGHTGAQPTCTTSVICTACGGTIAALGHDFSVQQHDEDTHWKKCTRCDATDGRSEHDWDNGKVTVPASCITAGEKKYTCRECGFEKNERIDAKGHIYGDAWQHDATYHWHDCSNCDEKLDMQEHTGGTATCTEKAKCAVCGESYGDPDPGNHAPDGLLEWTKTATTHEQKWSCCGAVTVASEGHAWTDGVCQTCGYVCTHDDTDQDHICDLCGQVVSDHQDTDNDHICDLCGKAITDHTGGTATCTEKAKCAVCGESYGDPDPGNHANLKHIAAKAATKDARGNIEYWYCGDCGKCFADAAATKEIKQADTVTAKLPEESKSPQTGASDPALLWFALLFFGGVCTALTVKRRKVISTRR